MLIRKDSATKTEQKRNEVKFSDEASLSTVPQ